MSTDKEKWEAAHFGHDAHPVMDVATNRIEVPVKLGTRSSEEQQASAWRAVFDALRRAYPNYTVAHAGQGLTGTQRAVKAIEEMAALAFGKPAAQEVKPAKRIDGCTESNCKRCRTHPDHRGDMEHAGIGWRPGQAEPDSLPPIAPPIGPGEVSTR